MGRAPAQRQLENNSDAMDSGCKALPQNGRLPFANKKRNRKKHYGHKQHGYKNYDIRRRSLCRDRVARLYRPRLHGYAPQCGSQSPASIFRRLGDLFRLDGHAGGGSDLLPCVWSSVWPARSGGFRRWRNGLHHLSGSTGFGRNGPPGTPDLRCYFRGGGMDPETSLSHTSSPLSKKSKNLEEWTRSIREQKKKHDRRRPNRWRAGATAQN